MSRDAIKQLNGDAARLLLVLLTHNGTEHLEDLPNLTEMAGLTHSHNAHGKNRYVRAFQQLKDLRFIEVHGQSICVPFEDLLTQERDNTKMSDSSLQLQPE
jgi:hypothetical protein